MRDLLLHATAPLRSLRLVVQHLVLNALLIASASYWLLIPEARVWQLAFTVVSALLIVCAFLWLHSGTFVFASDPQPTNFRPAFSIKLTSWIPLFLGLAILFWLMHRVDVFASSRYQIAGYVYSKTPSWLHPTHGSAVYVRAVGFFLSIVTWYLLPGLILPVSAARVVGSELRSALRALRSWQYWLGLAVTISLGVWVTQALMGWTPGTSLAQQTTSLVIRLAFAYLLATSAWLLTIGLLGYFVGPRNSDVSAQVVGQSAA